MIISQSLLDELTAQAKANPRLRQAYDLRNSENDNSQRMLNALEPGTVMPIHRHRKTSETICMVGGKMVMRLYDDKGNVTDEFVMSPAGSVTELAEVPMVQNEAGQWHSLEVLEEGTVVFEAKDGRYEPVQGEDIMRDAWNATVLALAITMFPEDASQKKWRDHFIELNISAMACPSDLHSNNYIDGYSFLNLPGSNINDDGTVINH